MSLHKVSRAIGPSDAELLAIGKLQFLASFCPLHQQLPAANLARIFHPALNNGCVRFFENEHGQTAAALIWARLDHSASTCLLEHGTLPSESEWVSGKTLWFLDLLAPFGHGRIVARSIARTPPNEPFFFARLTTDGTLRKVVHGNTAAPVGKRLITLQNANRRKGQ
ncbi:MAG: toxin-activating lysine-acyltransferase [Shimia sp.]|uniref:toxin-activating lysine-acyltransferase n=1 Tax=Shimia sp. TaxID=1954381 RepID=UPI004057E530